MGIASSVTRGVRAGDVGMFSSNRAFPRPRQKAEGSEVKGTRKQGRGEGRAKRVVAWGGGRRGGEEERCGGHRKIMMLGEIEKSSGRWLEWRPEGEARWGTHRVTIVARERKLSFLAWL